MSLSCLGSICDFVTAWEAITFPRNGDGDGEGDGDGNGDGDGDGKAVPFVLSLSNAACPKLAVCTTVITRPRAPPSPISLMVFASCSRS